VWRDGYRVEEQKILVLQFDRFICFTDDMAKEQEWTPEDKEYAARGLESQLNDPMFRDMWIHQPVLPDKPWPTYDETHPKQIHTVAIATGMVEQALAYESRGRADGPRPSVVENLQKALNAQQPAEEPVEESDDSDDLFAA
jgi:hypothetical protein